MPTKHPPDRPWLALDVGGANIKAAHEMGRARSLAFELWKNPADLSRVLAGLASDFPPAARIALTMTAELCDCFATKAEGVLAVLAATLNAFPGLSVATWCVDGRFRGVEAVRDEPRLAAASNWLALAEVAARVIPAGPALLIDIGSTTADLIPLAEGHARPRGRADTDRLQAGELVYAGVRRTPLSAIAAELPYRGMPTGLAAELFATTLDVYLTLGAIPADPGDHATADGRPATRDAALSRLARMICTDGDEFTADDALAFARSADAALLTRLESAARRACDSTVGPPHSAVISGSGEHLARRLAARLLGPSAPIVSLREAWGHEASSAACAHALVILARESWDDLDDTPKPGRL